MRVWLVLLSLLVVPAAACGGGGGGSDAPGDASDVRDVPDVAPDGDAVPDEGDAPLDGDDASADEGDGPVDDGDVPADEGDGSDAGRELRTVVTVTAGGGTVRNDRYQLTLGVGVPQPMGGGDGGAHAVRLGPGAVLSQ
jgi:hypothetical protein